MKKVPANNHKLILEDGEWCWPRRKNFILVCCDCALKHKVTFRLVPHRRGKRIEFKMSRA